MKFSFHDGEKEIQRILKAPEIRQVDLDSRIHDFLTPPAARFLSSMHLLFIAIERNGKIWSTLAYGSTGFISCPNQNLVLISLAHISFLPEEYRSNISTMIGLLAIDFHSAQRMRCNGTGYIEENNLYITPSEVYANCPKYIQKRKLRGIANNLNKDHSIKLSQQ